MSLTESVADGVVLVVSGQCPEMESPVMVAENSLSRSQTG